MTVNDDAVTDLNFGTAETSIPEPGSIVGLLGLAGAGAVSRLRQKKGNS